MIISLEAIDYPTTKGLLVTSVRMAAANGCPGTFFITHFENIEMTFDKNETQSVYDKRFIFGVTKCLPIRDLRIGHVSLVPFTAIPSRREPFSRVRRLGTEGHALGSSEERSHLHLRLHFNP